LAATDFLTGAHLRGAKPKIAREWLAKQPFAPKTMKKAVWTFEDLLFPYIGAASHLKVYRAQGLAMIRVAFYAGFLVRARRTVLSVSALSLLSTATVAMAGVTDNTTTVIDNPAYTHAQRLVEIEPGRRLNLYCTGKGSPTVVFDSGGGDETIAWAPVQPVIAAHTQACSYDRAGLGFSDPGKRTSDSANIVDDLHRLLTAAAIKPPYVLVGASYGGMNVRLYADTYPTEVVGMVLVDSTSEDWKEEELKLDPRHQTVEQARAQNFKTDWQSRRDCVKAAWTGFVEGTELYKRCVGEPNPTESMAINDAELNAHLSLGHQQALLSEDESIFFASADEVRAARRWYGAMPLILLTSAPLTKARANETPEFRGALNRLHAVLADQMAARSTRGIVRPVPNSTHEIQLTQPDAVNSAILEVLGEASQQK
jgi:pimeloyl-ACP methyl ester carboxylesterase